ncbi:hypothetical protein Salat_1155800 [Sesamum alatum]|uniref:Myb/SANT-like domain-containing protein n=1 Tax=Sesamum alatum TaxID=300844 RepID=A0AAE1YE39_9LAMI|nr:hypothetical protein Salat_1155800 [Sesamum alatum]
MYTLAVVNIRFGWQFYYNVIKKKGLERLCLRYKIFQRILQTFDFQWDREENVVHGSDEDWNHLCNEIEFGNAYRFERESFLKEPSTIFGLRCPDDGVHRIMAISSDDDGSDDEGSVDQGSGSSNIDA